MNKPPANIAKPTPIKVPIIAPRLETALLVDFLKFIAREMAIVINNKANIMGMVVSVNVNTRLRLVATG